MWIGEHFSCRIGAGMRPDSKQFINIIIQLESWNIEAFSWIKQMQVILHILDTNRGKLLFIFYRFVQSTVTAKERFLKE
jgi:hypothetical protein